MPGSFYALFIYKAHTCTIRGTITSTRRITRNVNGSDVILLMAATRLIGIARGSRGWTTSKAEVHDRSTWRLTDQVCPVPGRAGKSTVNEIRRCYRVGPHVQCTLAVIAADATYRARKGEISSSWRHGRGAVASSVPGTVPRALS